MNSNGNLRQSQIGLDRIVRLAWIEKTASLVSAGNDSGTIKSILQDDLEQFFKSSDRAVRGSLDKTITILIKTWLTAPQNLESLRVAGLQLLTRLPQSQHVAVNWGMLMAVYPFWGSVASQAGRLLRLQDTVSAHHIQRRMREQYGERETVSRRARYVVRSFLDWGVLAETGVKGTYSAQTPLDIDDHTLISWLLEALLHTQSTRSVRMKEALTSSAFFPFQLKLIGSEELFAVSPHITIAHDGACGDLIMLEKLPVC